MFFNSLTSVCVVSSLLLAFATCVPVDNNELVWLKLAQANDDFGLRLLQQLENESLNKGLRENIFISPFSIHTVLSMLMAGSAQQTYSEIHNTLGLNNAYSDKQLFQGYQQLLYDLTHDNVAKSANVLEVANSIVVQNNYPLYESFLENITGFFEAESFSENFAVNAHKATEDINQWVREKTHNKITKLYDSDLDPSTILCLLNAVYFKGTWQTKFAKEHTKMAPFHLSRDMIQTVNIMNVKSYFKYANVDEGQLLEIPYKNETMSMYILLSNDTKGTLSSLSSKLQANTIRNRISQLEKSVVNVQIPKFKIEKKYLLADTLKQMGIKQAFSGDADFSNMNGHKDLQLSDVVQKTYIEVNEEGSEAAAVTGTNVVRSMAKPIHDIEFQANRPFMFFIRHNQHQVTLFAGIINKP